MTDAVTTRAPTVPSADARRALVADPEILSEQASGWTAAPSGMAVWLAAAAVLAGGALAYTLWKKDEAR